MIKTFTRALQGALLAAVCCSLLVPDCASAAGTWQADYSAVAMTGMATNGSIYVASATNGIWTSTDLKSWTRVALPATAQQGYYDVIYGDGMFVAVGNSLGAVITSTDGLSWTVAYSGPSDGSLILYSVAYDGVSTFIAVGKDAAGAVALRYVSGGGWVPKRVIANAATTSGGLPAEEVNILVSVVWGNGQFVTTGDQDVMGQDGSLLNINGLTYTSADGAVWTASATQLEDSDEGNNLAYGTAAGGPLYLSGFDNVVATSSDAMSWAFAIDVDPSGNEEWLPWRTTYANGRFVSVGTHSLCPASGGSCTQHNGVGFSSDGATWTYHDIAPRGPSLRSISAILPSGASDYILGGYLGVYQSSGGGASWRKLFTGPQAYLTMCAGYASVGGKNEFIAPGREGNLTSTDGKIWKATPTSVFTDAMSGQGCIASNGNLLVMPGIGVVGLNWSSDGVTWTAAVGLLASFYYGVAFDQGVFYTIGSQGSFAYAAKSSDGKTWTTLALSGLPASTDLKSIGNPVSGFVDGAALTAGGGKLFTWGQVNAGGFIASSSDGAKWVTGTGVPAGAVIAKVSATQGRYLAIGQDSSKDSLLLSSTDGKVWSQESVPASAGHVLWQDILFNGQEWMAMGQDAYGRFVWMSSTDGSTWSVEVSRIGNFSGHDAGSGTSSLASDGSQFVTVTQYDVLQHDAQSSGGGSSGGGGGGTGGGSSGGGGGGAFGFALLGLLAGLTVFYRKRRYS